MSQATSLGGQPVTASPSSGKGLDEWSFAIDSKTGNVYFYNRRTRETRWTLPGNESTSSGSLISSLSHAHDVLKKVQAEEEQKTTANDLTVSNQVSKSSNGSEKENHIREAVDPHTGMKYYYDTITRKSYWEDPRVVGTALLNQRGPDTPERQRIIPTATINDVRAMRTLSSAKSIGFDDNDTTTMKITLNGASGAESTTTKRPTESTSIVDELRGLSVSRSIQKINRGDNQIFTVNGELKEELMRPKPVEQSPMLKSTKTQAEDSVDSVKPTNTAHTMTSQQGLTSTWSSIPDMELTKRSSASTDTFLKRSVSTKSSSQERLLPFVIERNEDEYNEDDLRLLKERIKMKKTNSISSPQQRKLLKPQVSEVKPSKPSTTTKSEEVKNEVTRNDPNLAETGFGAKMASKIQPKLSSSASVNGRAGASSDTCLRKSGCTCRACSTGIQETIAEDPTDLVPCGTCGRKFNHNSLSVHERVCDKVFAKRSTSGKSPEIEDAKAESKKIASTPVVSQGMSKWRKQSQELRQAMMRGRNSTSSTKSMLADSSMFNESGMDNNGNSEVFDDGLVTCPHCERRFSEKAAERHIPKCNDIRSKPKTLRKGEGRAVHTALLNSPALGGPNSPSKTTPGSHGARKSLGSGGQQHASLGDRVTGVACPFCRRQFAVKNLEKHLEICAQQRAGPRTSFGGRSSVAAGSLLRKQTSASPSSRSSGSWDGGHFE